MLWEIRFLLRSLGKTNPRARTLGDELEKFMNKKEEERPCLVCMGATLKDAGSRSLRVCSRHHPEEMPEEMRR